MHQTWLDALANNIANANTAPDRRRAPSRRRWSSPRRSPAAASTSPASRSATPRASWSTTRTTRWPTPTAYVRLPPMDMASQMSQLIMAQRGFQASVQVTKSAQDTYTAAIGIGR